MASTKRAGKLRAVTRARPGAPDARARARARVHASSEQAASRDKGKFAPGRSGNPAGRPKGIEDKRVALRVLLEPHAPKLVEKVVALALKGDTTALRICMDRLIPPVKARNEAVRLPGAGGTLAQQGQAVLTAAGEGLLSPDELAALMQAIGAQVRVVEVDEILKRVAALEEIAQKGRHRG